MKTYSKRRTAVPLLFQDTPPPPKQKIFPHRRQTITPKTPSSTISISRWKQQTLTQQIPDLQCTRSDEDLESLEEYDVAAADTPPNKNRRTSSKRQQEQQQTITQMDPTKSLLYPQEELLDPVSDENEDTKPKRKKAKTNIAYRSTRKPRPSSRAERAAYYSMPQKKSQTRRQDASKAFETALMPPPKTPQSNRRTEIPSSQSPADSPICTPGSRSPRQSIVSPLKERSINVASKPPPSRMQARSGAPTLEIADSKCAGKGGHQKPVHAIPRVTTLCFPQEELKSTSDTIPFLKASRGSTMTDSSEELPMSEYKSVAQGSLPYGTIPIKSEIQDSANENYDENDETGEVEDIEPTQAISSSSAGSLDHPIRADPLEVQLRTSDPRSFKKPLDQKNHAAPMRIDVDHRHGFDSEKTLRLPQDPQSPLANISAFSNDENTDAIHSDSELASAQLTNDLQRYNSASRVLTPVLETESQFESAWRALIQLSDDDQHEQGHLQNHSLAAEENSHMPEQRLPTAKQGRHPVPFSRATTTDITQASARQRNSDLLGRPSTQLLTSSPRASSNPPSPFQLQKSDAVDLYVGYGGWNGVRMTDSQLLPDSLMKASVPKPPPFSQESLLEDER
ncbi:MAG: hypothetical protein LQ342_006758 [Letrouitia transgressa]|nr:MAG: hypothetical protein LQ342_006758 [Letrouitia transgressa]